MPSPTQRERHRASSLRVALDAHGGVLRLQQLLEIGLTRHEVAFLHRTGALIRPRVGWYCDPRLTAAAIQALRVGGVMGCVSAAASWGIVVPERHDAIIHVSLAQNASRLRRAGDGHPVAAGDDRAVVWHWDRQLEPIVGHRVAPIDALLQMSRCIAPIWLVAAVDSAMHQTQHGRLIDPGQVARLREALAPGMRPVIDLADGVPEAPGESILKVRFHEAHIPFSMQVRIGRRRTDFVIDGWIVVEADGRPHHTGDAFADDRARDLELAGLGYRVIRLTYRQIIDDWPGVLAVLERVRAERRSGNSH